MRNRAILLPLLTAAACSVLSAQRYEQRRDFSKTAALAAGKSFRIEHSNGNLAIKAVPGTQLQIQAVIRCSARREDQARACADGVQINVDETSSGVLARTVYPRINNVSFSVDFEISMPQGSPLDVRNRFGAVQVSNLQSAANINNTNGAVTFTDGRGVQRVENAFGKVEVRSNQGDVTVINHNGDVTVADITGKADVSNRFGNIRVTNATRGLGVKGGNSTVEAEKIGGFTTITNTFGGVTARDVTGDLLVQNQNGRVQAEGVTGAANLSTSFERVTASRVGKGLTVRAQNASVVGDGVGEAAVVETTFGSVELRQVKGGARVTAGNSAVRVTGVGGEVYAKSTFAGVDVADAGGPVTVENQNGHVAVQLRPGKACQPVTLSSTFAPIRVTLPAGAGYNVSARTTFGKIHSGPEMTVNGAISPEALTGRIGGGGCELRLTGQNGDIDILQAK